MNWKAPGIAAAAAFVFSVFVGLLSTVSFPVVLVRALFWSVIFAAGGFGVTLVVKRFLPELMEIKTVSSEEEEAEEAVQRVNIVLEDDEPFAVRSGEGKGDESYAGGEIPDDEEGGFSAEENISRDSAKHGPIFEDEDGNLFGAYAGTKDSGGTRGGDDSASSDGAELEELPAADEGSFSGKTRAAEPSSSQKPVPAARQSSAGDDDDEDDDDAEEAEEMEELDGDDDSSGEEGDEDDMPDIASFDDLEGTAGMADAGMGDAVKLVEVNGQEQDPREMAKAIQTVMKKQKG